MFYVQRGFEFGAILFEIFEKFRCVAVRPVHIFVRKLNTVAFGNVAKLVHSVAELLKVDIQRSARLDERTVESVIFCAHYEARITNLAVGLLRVVPDTIVTRKQFGLEASSVRVNRVNFYIALTFFQRVDERLFVLGKSVEEKFGHSDVHRTQNVETRFDMFPPEKASCGYSKFHKNSVRISICKNCSTSRDK